MLLLGANRMQKHCYFMCEKEIWKVKRKYGKAWGPNIPLLMPLTGRNGIAPPWPVAPPPGRSRVRTGLSFTSGPGRGLRRRHEAPLASDETGDRVGWLVDQFSLPGGIGNPLGLGTGFCIHSGIEEFFFLFFLIPVTEAFVHWQ